MNYSNDCVELVKEFEGLYLEAYYCPSGVLTIGYGHTKNVRSNTIINEAKADILLKADLDESARYVEYYLHKYKFENVKQCQFDALVSFTFNCGCGNLNKMLSGCKTVYDIPAKMSKYNKSSHGVVLTGLVRRRNAEINLFEKEGSLMFASIKKGSKNESVGVWQVLNKLTVDNVFGEKTHKSVIQFQEKYGLEVDGVVGKKTWQMLLSIKGYL